MKHIFFILTFIIFSLSTLPQADAFSFGKKKPELLRSEQPLDEITPGYERKVFVSPDKKRKPLTYFWFQPEPPYPDNLKFPLVLILHDNTGKAQAGKSLVSPEMQTAYPAFIMVPALPATSVWANPKPIVMNDGKLLGGTAYEALHDAVDLIKSLPSQYPIDTKRIYVVGCAEGGMGAFGAVLNYPNVFAAAVPISGAWSPEDSPKMTKTPIWAFHGAQDDVMPSYLTKDMVNLIHEYGGPIFYTEYPVMKHDCNYNELYSPPMWEWIFKQHRQASTQSQ